MKNIYSLFSITATILLFPQLIFAQAPTLGAAASFVLFSSAGAVTNTGPSHITGNVGTNSGSSTGFGNVNGVMADGGSLSAQASTDLLTAYNLLDNITPTSTLAPLLGNGQTLVSGVYSISSASTLNGNLILNGQNNPNAVFIFKIEGAFSTSAAAKVKLINGALACNVFWKVEGLVSMATKTNMKGTIVANNAAINFNTLDTLEGRAFSTAGEITLDGVLAYTPIGCGSPVLTGPDAPALGSVECYALFSANGAVSNSGITNSNGDVGTNVGLTTGFDTLLITGEVHPGPDISTALCASDLTVVYNYLNTLPNDILLLYPAQFGNNLVLTPHTYLLGAATVLTDTLFLNAQGNANAVFVIKINGAFSTSTYSKVKLINGAQAKNVFWKIEGAVSINNFSVFCGTIICNNGAINALNTGVVINGRALTTDGEISTVAIKVMTPTGCISGAPDISTQPKSKTACIGNAVSYTVIAQGTGLTYRWRKGNTNLNNGGNISGAQSAILTINPVLALNAATNYNVVVSGAVAPRDTSINVSLTINSSPNITTQPSNKVACVGSSASFAVASSGVGINYQWRKGNANLSNGGNISGAQSATLIINPITISDTSNLYNVIIRGTCLPNDTSAKASLSLCPSGINPLGASNENIVNIYPNPFQSSITVFINEGVQITNAELHIYNIVGAELLKIALNKPLTTVDIENLPKGVYVYKVTNNKTTIQTGKLISQQ